MKGLINKILAIVLIFTLVGMSFISDIVYASNVISLDLLDQTTGNIELNSSVNNATDTSADITVNEAGDTTANITANTENNNASNNNTGKTVENKMVVNATNTSISATGSESIIQNNVEITENKGEAVEFNATINGSNDVTADISEELKLHLLIYVRHAGYLKDLKVVLNESNYMISKTAEEINKMITEKNPNVSKSKLIRTINNNEIILDEIDAGDSLEIDIPIKFNKKETVSAEDYNKESQIELNGTFVNSKNINNYISKKVTERVRWIIKAESSIKQELIRYLKYNEKTMVSFEITDEIKDNIIPAGRKEINITVPKLEGELPSYITVTGDNIEQKYENGIVTIIKNNTPNDQGQYKYETQDKYIVTYIFNKQTEMTVIETTATEKTITIANTEIQSTTEKIDFEVKAEIGSIVGMQVALPGEISKGYMFTNLNRNENKLDTTYYSIYRINIGYADLTDRITVTEDLTTLNDENNNVLANINNEIKAKKVAVPKEELISVLGEEGYIIVKNENGEEIGKLNKDIQELNIDVSKLSFETTKPIKEGDININLEKQILGSVNFTKDGLNLIKKLSAQVTVSGYSGENEISKSSITGNINLTNPTSKGSVDTNIDVLSTVSPNENVVFNIVLNKTDIGDALYTNPAIRITLPSQVSNINVTSARVVYDEELNAGNISVNGNEIIIRLEGTQTQYNTLETTKGTLVRLVTNIGLDYLLPSSQENLKVEIYNEFTGELNTVEKPIKIVAPNDFIRTHEIKIDNETKQAIDSKVSPIKLNVNDSAKTMDVSAQIINNLGKTAEGFTIVGRLPFEGNKTIGGQELGSNINTSLLSPIEVEGLENATIYYSNNGEETFDSINWTTQPIQDAKSFKIDTTTGLNDKQLIKFKYSVSIPENLDYEKTGKFNYGIYYNNNAQTGIGKNLIEAETLGFETGIAPTLKIGLTSTDTNEGYLIPEGGEVREGQYITYRIKIVNTGSESANDVALAAALPEGMTLITSDLDLEDGSLKYIESNSKLILEEVGTVNGGEDEDYEFTVKVSDKLLEEEKDKGKDLMVAVSLTADILGENPIVTSQTVKNKPGYFSVKLTTDVVGFTETKDEVNYRLLIKNANNDNKTNLNVKLNLPEGIKYEDIDAELRDSVQYDEKNNSLTINAGTLERNDKIINIKTKNERRGNENLKTQAHVTCDGLNGEIKSNEVEFYSQDSKDVVKVVQSTNASKNLTDNDDIIYYVDITNNGLIGKTITYEDEISPALGVEETTTDIDGKAYNLGQTNYINTQLFIPAKTTIRITTKTKPYPIEQGNGVRIENKPKITLSNDDEIEANSVEILVNGTTDVQSEELVEEGTYENSVSAENEQKYKITGSIWFDENKNGKNDVIERGLPNISLQLYDNNKKQIVKDSSNTDITVTTNENGEYSFENLTSGDYLVIASYDSIQFEIGDYRADEVAESENSDFVTAKFDNKDVASTEIVNLDSVNAYNIDLGLIEKEQFNLNIDQSITRVTISGENNKARVIDYDENEAELELTEQELKKSTMLVEYNVKISNNGTVPGYAKQIMNYIPKGMTFNSELNPEWYVGKDGNLYTVYLGDQVIEPGQSKDIKLTLVKHFTNSSSGIMRGRAELENVYNEKGLESINALSSNYSNLSGTNLILLKQSKVKIIAVIGLSIGLIALIGLAVFEIKKHLIDKMYNYDDLDFLNK